MNWLFPRAFFDAPQVLSASVTPIPGSGDPPLQVVANLGIHSTYAVDYIDSTGDYIGIYVGAPGQEILKCIVGGVMSIQGVVSGTAIPISAAALPLPSGASTSALQTTGNASLSSIDAKLIAYNSTVRTSFISNAGGTQAVEIRWSASNDTNETAARVLNLLRVIGA